MGAKPILPAAQAGAEGSLPEKGVVLLNYLRRRVAETLAPVQRAVLTTWGPADIQAGEYACEALGLNLYLAVPLASDHLFNLETRSRVVVLGDGWRLHGTARCIARDAAPASLRLARAIDPRRTALVEVWPTRFDIEGSDQRAGETIDIEPVDAEDVPHA